MNIYFRILFPPTGEERSEFDLAVPESSQAESLARMKWFEGAIVIKDTGGPDVVIEGALEAWVQNLCFDSVVRMLSGAPSRVTNFSGPGTILLEPEGDAVRLSGDRIAAARFEIRKLAPALVGCGVRFLDWARAVKSADPSYRANLDYIETFRAPAEAALAAAGMALRDRG